MIRTYFLDYRAMNTDVRVDLGTHTVDYLGVLKDERSWKVTLAATGLEDGVRQTAERHRTSTLTR